MATATRHTTIQQQIAAARDEHRSGALDIEGAHTHASLFFVFGQPGHAVFEGGDGRSLHGQAALNALVAELPADYRIAPWRQIMVTEDSLRCTADELIAMFGEDTDGEPAPQLSDSPATAPPPPPQARTSPVPFGVDDFPLLPAGRLLWTDEAANVNRLAAVAPHMPNSLVTLAGGSARALVVIVGGAITDAVFVDAARGLVGDDAVNALSDAEDGTVTSYGVDDARVLAALPLLWRLPRLPSSLPAAWLKADTLAAEVRRSARSCAVLVASADPGIALFVDGELATVYTASRPRAVSTMTAFRALLRPEDAEVTIVGFGVPAFVPDAPADPVDEPLRLFVARDDSVVVVNGSGGYDDEEVAAAPGSLELTLSDAPAPVATESVDPLAGEPAENRDDVAGAPAGFTLVESPRDRVPTFGLPADEAEHTFLEHTDDGAWRAVDVPRTQPASMIDDSVSEPAPANGTAPAGEDDEPMGWRPRAVVDEPELKETAFEDVSFGTLDVVPPPPPSEELFASQAQEFVPTRLDLDVDALRTELNGIAAVWLGADDTAAVAEVIAATRPGVDDFVAAIAAIGSMEIPGHEQAVVRAMAREMHFRAAEVLCGV
jgi:hypothetical protein